MCAEQDVSLFVKLKGQYICSDNVRAPIPQRQEVLVEDHIPGKFISVAPSRLVTLYIPVLSMNYH